MNQTVIKPKTTREVKKFLKPPLSNSSIVIYFTEKDKRPFVLTEDKEGISIQQEYKLTNKWRLTKDKLDRVIIVTSETDLP